MGSEEQMNVKEKNRRKQPVTMFKRAWMWSEKEEKLYASLCVGKTLHLFSGKNGLGDVRVDIEGGEPVTMVYDLTKLPLPFDSQSFDTLILDPPWVGPQTWHNWTDFIYELVRIARKRIVFILGNMFYLVPSPFKHTESYIVKMISPQVKLVHVWDKTEEVLTQ